MRSRFFGPEIGDWRLVRSCLHCLMVNPSLARRLTHVWWLPLCSAQEDDFLTLMSIAGDPERPPQPPPRQLRRLTAQRMPEDGRIDQRPYTSLLLDRLLAGSELSVRRSLVPTNVVKRQPFQCLVNVVSCWKR